MADSCKSQLSNRSTETTKSELIQRILDSIQQRSNSTTNTSLSSIDQLAFSSAVKNFSNEIYLYFKNPNELGIEPELDDLIEFIRDSNKCSCQRMDIRFSNTDLNEQLSYKDKQSILRIILRRQLIFNQYFS